MFLKMQSDPEITLLGIYSRAALENMYYEAYRKMFMAALSIIIKNKKHIQNNLKKY